MSPSNQQHDRTDLSAFSGQLRLEEYFLDETTGWGLFRDRFGRLKQEFKVHAHGSWQNDQFHLHEYFIYRDGSEGERIWRITPQGQKNYIGTAEDIIGQAQGEVQGTSCRWQYKLLVPINERRLTLNFDDYLQLMPDGCLLGHAKVSKFGFYMGDVVLSFQKNIDTRTDPSLKKCP
jgi:hypothetical protein